MTITIIIRKQEYHLDANITVKEAMDKLCLSTETHLAMRNGELINENEVLRTGDVVKMIAAISGGNQ